MGNTPQLAIKNITAARSKCLSDISNIIKTKLAVKPGESVFIYVRSAFAPSPDARIADLFDVSKLSNYLSEFLSLISAYN